MLTPRLLRTQTEIRMRRGLLPKHLVRHPVRLRVVVNNQTLLVRRTRIHHLTKHLETREHTRLLLPDTLPVRINRLAQNKHLVDVRPQVRWNTERLLHRNDKQNVLVTPVHKQ